MTSTLRLLAVTAVLAVTPLLPASAQSISPDQRKEIEAIIKDYLIKNPAVENTSKSKKKEGGGG